MTGCLQTKKDMFYIVLNTYENGKRKQKWIGTGLPVKGNKRKAEQLLREKLHEYELKGGVVASDMILADYVRHWLTIAQRRVDTVTYRGYESMAKLHVLPYFDASGVLLKDVDLPTLQAYFDQLATKGRTDGKGGLAPASLRRYKNVLNQTLNEAVKAGLLPSNPCQFVELPKLERYESHFYSAQQLQRLFDAIQDEDIYPLVRITALYGLRRSEVLGLQWDSIDFSGGTLTIKHTVVNFKGIVEKDKTKNASSYRTFPLTPEAEAIFRSLKDAEAENRRLFGWEYQANEYVFKWPNGKLFDPDYVTRRFSKLLAQNNLPHIRFHELRHSCASLLINQGFHLKDVQEWLGHADIQMTANIYGHLDIQRKQSMADQLSAALG